VSFSALAEQPEARLLLAAAGLEVSQQVLPVLGHGLDVEGDRRQQPLLAGGHGL
jgi:hypothetical protein